MDLTYSDIQQINAFLKRHHLDSQELYEEFYDHIVTSFENQEYKPKCITQHLAQLEKDFGGAKGIKKILIARHKSYYKIYDKILIKHFKDLLRWPLILYSLLLSFGIYQLTLVFDPSKLFVFTLIAASLISFTYILRLTVQFRLTCRKEQRGYNHRLSHSAILRPNLLIVVVLNLWNLINGGRVILGLEPGLQSLIITILTMLIVLHTIACGKLVNDEIRLKTSAKWS